MVLAGVAPHEVVAVAAIEPVVSADALDRIVAGAAEDLAGAGAGEEQVIVAVAAVDQVGHARIIANILEFVLPAFPVHLVPVAVEGVIVRIVSGECHV